MFHLSNQSHLQQKYTTPAVKQIDTSRHAITTITLHETSHGSGAISSPMSSLPPDTSSRSKSILHLSTINILSCCPTLSPTHPVQLTFSSRLGFHGGGQGNCRQNDSRSGSRCLSAIDTRWSKLDKNAGVGIGLYFNSIPF